MIKNKNALWQTEPQERVAYYSFFAGQNMIYCMISTFLVTYLALSGVNPMLSGTVMLIVKIWDAVNDAIFGVIFDRVRFKSGKKYLPWLKISCALTPVATIALFAIPGGSSQTIKIIWFAVAYIIWDTAYTLNDVPAYGIITAMTSNIEERNTVLSYKSITGGIGSAVTTVIASVLVSEAIGLNYTWVGVIVAILAAVTMAPICFKCKERYVGVDEETFTLKRMFQYIIKNKYLLIYYFGYFFYSGFQTYNSLHQIMAYYIFDNSLASLITGTIAAAPQLIFSLLVPTIIRKVDKMTLYKWSTLALIITSIAVIPCRNNFILFAITYTLRAIPMGIVGVLGFIFTPDCAEYGQYKTGIEAKGITFAIQTFMVKLCAALQGSLALFLLGLFGYKSYENAESFADLAAIGATQSDKALDGIWFTYTIFPIIGVIGAYIVWHFYRLKDKDIQIMADCNAGRITREEAETMLSKKY